MGKLSLYVTDTETTSLELEGDIIEVSFLRVSDGEQRTWHLKAMNEKAIQSDALETNGYKLEDILGQTKEGKEKHLSPEIVLPQIENWLYEDGVTKADRILVGQNIGFDSERLALLWKRCGAEETYPFGRNAIDTKVLAVFFDWIQDVNSRWYSLGQIVKRLGITKRKAHTAANDVQMTHDVMLYFKKFFSTLIDKSEVPLPLLGELIEEAVEDKSLTEENEISNDANEDFESSEEDEVI